MILFGTGLMLSIPLNSRDCKNWTKYSPIGLNCIFYGNFVNKNFYFIEGNDKEGAAMRPRLREG